MKRHLLIPLVMLLVAGNVTAGLLAYRWYAASQDLDARNAILQTKLGETVRKLSDIQTEPAPGSTLPPKPPPAIRDDTEALALRESLAQRESELGALRDQLAQQEAKKASRSSQSFFERMRERMETMQKENPEEFARIQERRNNMQTEMSDRIVEQTDFFSAVDLEGLPPDYVENHQQLVTELGALQTMIDEMANNPSAFFDRHSEMRERYAHIRELMKVEREVLMTDLAGELDLDEQGATDFSEYIDFLYQMTTPPRPSWRGRGRSDGGSR